MSTTKYENLDPDVSRGLDALVITVARVMREQRRCCLTCCNFDEPSEGCNIANGQRPPARVVAYGCAGYLATNAKPVAQPASNVYVDDSIPF